MELRNLKRCFSASLAIRNYNSKSGLALTNGEINIMLCMHLASKGQCISKTTVFDLLKRTYNHLEWSTVSKRIDRMLELQLLIKVPAGKFFKYQLSAFGKNELFTIEDNARRQRVDKLKF